MWLLIALSAGAAVMISVWLWRSGGRPGTSGRLRFGLALIAGGALGNLYDRARRGAVVDFLELYAGEFRWPAFNLADTAITVGAALALWDMWRSRRAGQGA
jgi:signal peptidase II